MRTTEESKELSVKEWAEAWKRATPVLEQLRIKEMREGSTENLVEAFNDVLEQSVHENPPIPWSGLIEQQRYFKMLAVGKSGK